MANEFNDVTAEAANTVKCKDCGGNLKFKPGTQALNCEYCGANNIIEVGKVEIIENDYNTYIDNNEANDEKQTVSTVKCSQCGAATTLQPNVTSCGCPYCDTPLVVKDATTNSIIKPKYLLPFKIERNAAKDEFVKWVGGLWFAPNKLKEYAANSTEKLKGVYMPYWTYDSETSSDYSGSRGVHYYVTESYTDSNGNSQTRSVQRTNWYPTSGTVNEAFDDILICASHSLPAKLTRELEPWDLPALVSFDERFLTGFVSESYQVQLKEGFEEAKRIMQTQIETAIRRDIGGDVQQVTSIDTDYDAITFKHILLPLWISAYKYNDKVFRFTINARTGEVQGERPYSAIKITLFVLVVIAIVVGIVFLIRK
jgi:DNA-directed RNA polymerase subunit RPC12/RpoP